MADTSLTPERYFELIDVDTERLASLGEQGLDAPVPCCPGWTVDDVVRHTAQVYAHKVRVMADNAFPTDWPPTDHATREPVEFLRDAKGELFTEFSQHRVDEQTTTFSEDDTTIAFWIRRMALEVAVHRYDAELAHGEVTEIPADESLDGIDELLRVTLAGPWWDGMVDTAHPVDAVVAVESGGRRWVCDVREKSVAISTGDAVAAGTVSGDPQAVFLWLWGRVGDGEVTHAGDVQTVMEFRERIRECTD